MALLSQRSNANKAGQWLFKTSWPDMRFLNGQAADSFVPAVTSNIGRFISDQCELLGFCWHFEIRMKKSSSVKRH